MPTLSLKMSKREKENMYILYSFANIKAFFPHLTIFHSILSYYDKYRLCFLVGTKSLTYANIFVTFQVQGLNYKPREIVLTGGTAGVGRTPFQGPLFLNHSLES